MASLLLVSPFSPAFANEGTSKASTFACSGFNSALSPVQFSLSLDRNAGDHTIAFRGDQSSGLFGAVESVEHIAQLEGSVKDEYFIIDNGQKLRLSIEEEGLEYLTLLVRGTHPSENPTFIAVSRCERTPEELSTSKIVAAQVGLADRQSGRLIRVSQRIGFVCAFLSSPEQRTTLALLPDRENSFSDKAEYQVGDFLQTGTASVMGETLDGVQAFRAIVSISDANLIFTTNGKTGWGRLIRKGSSDSVPDFGVCLNSSSASGKSDQ